MAAGIVRSSPKRLMSSQGAHPGDMSLLVARPPKVSKGAKDVHPAMMGAFGAFDDVGRLWVNDTKSGWVVVCGEHAGSPKAPANGYGNSPERERSGLPPYDHSPTGCSMRPIGPGRERLRAKLWPTRPVVANLGYWP